MKLRRLSNDGNSLVTVIMVMLVVMTFASIALTLVTSQTKSEIFYEENTGALHAAEAGLNMYLWDLNEDSGDVIPLNTVIYYPEYNPTSAYILEEVENTETKRVVNATGWMLSDPSVTRKVKASFTKKTFPQYIYFSNNDNYIEGVLTKRIYFGDSDIIYGPVHINNTLNISGDPIFKGPVTYVGSVVQTAGSNPRYEKGKAPVAAKPYPDNNSKLRNYAQEPYIFDGRTSIRLNENGTMTVLNPNETPNTQTLALPSNGVVYVNDRSGASNTDKFDEDNGTVFISGKLNGKLTIAVKRDIYITGYDPTIEDFESAPRTNGISYVHTKFTLDIANGVAIADDSTFGLEEADMLGLIADNNIAILTRGWFDGNNKDSSIKNIMVHAALFAINGKFGNSHILDNPSLQYTYPYVSGTLTIRGSIVQNIRGGVARNSSYYGFTGYAKDYAHDPRFLYEQPPHFLEPANSGWEIRDWIEM